MQILLTGRALSQLSPRARMGLGVAFVAIIGFIVISAQVEWSQKAERARKQALERCQQERLGENCQTWVEARHEECAEAATVTNRYTNTVESGRYYACLGIGAEAFHALEKEQRAENRRLLEQEYRALNRD